MIMLKLSFIINVLLLISCGFIGWSYGAKRTLTSSLNPDCPSSICLDKTITVVHIIADGPTDRLHYLWDFTGPPSILIALTTPNTNVTIDWSSFIDDAPQAVQFTSEPIYTASVILTKVFVFNDAEDTGTFTVTNSTEINTYNTQSLTWVRSDYHKSVHDVEVTVACDNTELFGNGNIKLKFKCFAEEDHDIDFPHLLHSVNATQVDIEFVKLTSKPSSPSTLPHIEHPRIAAEFLLMANESNQKSFTVSTRKTLDDEHTPGIFELIDIISPNSLMAAKGSYLQYRPVSYTHRERDVSTSTGVHISNPVNVQDYESSLNGSLAWSYYGIEGENLLAQGFNISFGYAQDGFYSRTNYTTWTFVMGYGTAPAERLSMFVLIVACIGLGIPLALLIGGGCYMCIKRVRNR